MKLSEFKKSTIFRLKLLRANTIFSARENFAFFLNNYGVIASTIFYMVTYLIFLKAIFGKVDTIAGYSYAEILLLTLITQTSFFLSWGVSMLNIEALTESIKSGELDLVLVKPVPHLWFVTFRKVNISLILFNFIPSVTPLALLLVKNADFHIEPINLLAGIYVSVVGLIIIHCLQFIVNCLAFWTEQGRSLFRISEEIAFFGYNIPWEGYPYSLKLIGLTLVPCLVHTALATSVILGKVDYLGAMTFCVTMIGISFLFFKNYIWKKGLRRYSSASS